MFETTGTQLKQDPAIGIDDLHQGQGRRVQDSGAGAALVLTCPIRYRFPARAANSARNIGCLIVVRTVGKARGLYGVVSRSPDGDSTLCIVAGGPQGAALSSGLGAEAITKSLLR